MKKSLLYFLVIVLPFLLTIAPSCDKEKGKEQEMDNDPVADTEWYSHSEETDPITGNSQDIITKLEFTKKNRNVIISETRNGKESYRRSGTYSVTSESSVALQIEYRSTLGVTTFTDFSDEGDGKWALRYTFAGNHHTNIYTVQSFVIFVMGRIPSPEEVAIL